MEPAQQAALGGLSACGSRGDGNPAIRRQHHRLASPFKHAAVLWSPLALCTGGPAQAQAVPSKRPAATAHLPSATISTSWCSEAPLLADPALAAAPASMCSSEVSTSTMGRSLMVLSWSKRICWQPGVGDGVWGGDHGSCSLAWASNSLKQYKAKQLHPACKPTIEARPVLCFRLPAT